MPNGFRGSCLDSHSSIAHTQSRQGGRKRHTQPCVWAERRLRVAERIAQMNSLTIDDGHFAALDLGPTGVGGGSRSCQNSLARSFERPKDAASRRPSPAGIKESGGASFPCERYSIPSLEQRSLNRARSERSVVRSCTSSGIGVQLQHGLGNRATREELISPLRSYRPAITKPPLCATLSGQVHA